VTPAHRERPDAVVETAADSLENLPDAGDHGGEFGSTMPGGTKKCLENYRLVWPRLVLPQQKPPTLQIHPFLGTLSGNS
jgi:hypothetical protein